MKNNNWYRLSCILFVFLLAFAIFCGVASIGAKFPDFMWGDLSVGCCLVAICSIPIWFLGYKSFGRILANNNKDYDDNEENDDDDYDDYDDCEEEYEEEIPDPVVVQPPVAPHKDIRRFDMFRNES